MNLENELIDLAIIFLVFGAIGVGSFAFYGLIFFVANLFGIDINEKIEKIL